jgi:hypothetical protein
METLRLRRMQEPSRVQRLLEAYVSRANILPEDSYPIRDPRELPPRVRIHIARALAEGQVWMCWARTPQIWLFTCEMSLALSRERGAPVLLLRCYDEEGELKDSGTWRYDALGAWSRCAE